MNPLRAARLIPLAASASSWLFAGCLQGTTLPSPTSTPVPATSATATLPATVPPTPTPTALPPGPLKTKTAGLAIVALEFGAGDDVVATLKNLGPEAIDLDAAKYQVCMNFIYGRLSKTRNSIPASGEVRVHLNSPAGCTESASEFCVENAGFVKNTSGNLSVYRGVNQPADFGIPGRMDDFVAWGPSGKQPREDEAVDAALWLPNRSVPVSAGQASLSVKVIGASGPDNWQ